MVHALVLLKFDCCKGLFACLPHRRIHKLQKYEHSIISMTPQRDHIDLILQSLHWLLVFYRIDYKIQLLVFKTIKMKPKNISWPLVYRPRHMLRLQTNNKLVEIKYNQETYGRRAFLGYTPRLWNSIPKELIKHQKIASSEKRFENNFV